MPLMKRLSFLFILAICALAVAAQDVVRVNYRGSRPTIRDFAVAYLSSFPGADEVEEGEQEGLRLLDDMKAALARQSKGQPLDKSETLTTSPQRLSSASGTNPTESTSWWPATGSIPRVAETSLTVSSFSAITTPQRR